MSWAKELLGASRSDAFLIRADTTESELRRLDLRLVQGFKRSGDSIEVKFVDLAKLCEIASREDAELRGAESEQDGIGRLRELLEQSAALADSAAPSNEEDARE